MLLNRLRYILSEFLERNAIRRMPIFDQNYDRRFAIVCVLLQSSQVTFLNIVYSVTLLERLRQIGELYFSHLQTASYDRRKKIMLFRIFLP